MDDETKRMFRHIVRVGKVSSINPSKRTARVILPDMQDMVTGELKLVYNGGDWLPDIGSWVLCLYTPVFDGDGYIVGGV